MSYAVSSVGRGRRREAMSGLGSLSIPDYTLWSTGDITAFYDQILDAVSHLETDIGNNAPHNADGDQLRTDYRSFKNSFLAHYGSYGQGRSYPAGSSATPVATAREDAGRYNAFEQRYHQLTGRSPTASGIAPVSVQSTPSPRVAGLPVWAWVGVGVLGLGMLGWIASSVSRASSSISRAAIGRAALAMNPRKRRRDVVRRNVGVGGRLFKADYTRPGGFLEQVITGSNRSTYEGMREDLIDEYGYDEFRRMQNVVFKRIGRSRAALAMNRRGSKRAVRHGYAVAFDYGHGFDREETYGTYGAAKSNGMKWLNGLDKKRWPKARYKIEKVAPRRTRRRSR